MTDGADMFADLFESNPPDPAVIPGSNQEPTPGAHLTGDDLNKMVGDPQSVRDKTPAKAFSKENIDEWYNENIEAVKRIVNGYRDAAGGQLTGEAKTVAQRFAKELINLRAAHVEVSAALKQVRVQDQFVELFAEQGDVERRAIEQGLDDPQNWKPRDQVELYDESMDLARRIRYANENGGELPKLSLREAFRLKVWSDEMSRISAEGRQWVKSGRAAFALQSATGSGGHLVPPAGFIAQVAAIREARNPIRQLATNVQVIQGGQGTQVTRPILTAYGAASNITNNPETSTAGAADPTVGEITLDTFVYGRTIEFTRKAQWASPINLTTFLADAAGRALAALELSDQATGDGANKIEGVFPGVANTREITAAFAADATWNATVLATKFHLNPEYWPNASWIMNPEIAQRLAGITIANNREFSVGANLGPFGPQNINNQAQGVLAGHPLYLTTAAPDLTANNRMMLLGDFDYYWRSESAPSLFADLSLTASNQTYGYYFISYQDARIALDDAFAVFEGSSI